MSGIGATCPMCRSIHCSTDVVAVGRFDPGGVRGYIPRAGGRAFATRAEAMSDLCATRAAAVTS